MKKTCPNCRSVEWYATHDGAGYAYPVCACQSRGCDIHPAPAGMDVAGSVSERHPQGLTVPGHGYVEA